VTPDARVAADIDKIVLEITRMLIYAAAGSQENIELTKRSMKSSLRVLINSTKIDNPTDLLYFDSACGYQSHFKLIVELVYRIN